jgi:hypothetical protein
MDEGSGSNGSAIDSVVGLAGGAVDMQYEIQKKFDGNAIK